MKNNASIYLLILCQLLYFGCKSENKLALESAIDQFIHISSNPSSEELQSLKNEFEKLSKINEDTDDQVTALYYLSEIALIEKKSQEAYTFISEAYKKNKADSIYKKKEYIEQILPQDQNNFIIQNSDEILIADTDNKILILKNNMQYIKENEVQDSSIVFNIDEDEKLSEIPTIIAAARSQIELMYNEKQYEGAIKNTNFLIGIISNNQKNSSKSINKGLSQLYQDLAILYAKINQFEKAKESINKAVELDNSQKNQEIHKLLNN